jgi:hypothetical protein
MRLFCLKSSQAIIEQLNREPKQLLYIPSTSKLANDLHNAGLLRREKMGREVFWSLTETCIRLQNLIS